MKSKTQQIKELQAKVKSLELINTGLRVQVEIAKVAIKFKEIIKEYFEAGEARQTAEKEIIAAEYILISEELSIVGIKKYFTFKLADGNIYSPINGGIFNDTIHHIITEALRISPFLFKRI